jgi:hypothetical protein
MHTENRNSKPKAGVAARGVQVVMAVSIAATMLIGSGAMTPSMAQGGNNLNTCYRVEEENICVRDGGETIEIRGTPEADPNENYTPSDPLPPNSSTTGSQPGGGNPSSSTPRGGQTGSSRPTTYRKNGKTCEMRVDHGGGTAVRYEYCYPTTDTIIKEDALCAATIAVTIAGCGSLSPLCIAGIVALFTCDEPADRIIDDIYDHPRTLQATVGGQPASAAPAQKTAQTGAAPARAKKPAAKRGKGAKGGKGKKRPAAQASAHGGANGAPARANSTQDRGSGHQTHGANNHHRGQGAQARGNGQQSHGHSAAQRNHRTDRGQHAHHSKGGKRR